jgi:MAGUK p55 subfamily protein 5
VKEIDGNIVISRVLCGGVADRSGMLHQGDTLHEINGRELFGLSVDDVADLMVTNRLIV